MKNILHVFSVIDTAEAFFDGQLKYLADEGFTVHLITSPSARAKPFSERNGTTYEAVKISRSITPFSDLKSLVSIISYIRKNRIEVVVGHTPKGALLSMLAAFIMRVPLRIYYRHGLVYTTKTGFARAILKNIEKSTAALATEVVNVSPSLADRCLKDGINAQKKQFIIGKGSCGGIDTYIKFNPANIEKEKLDFLKNKLNIGSDTFVIGFAGRFCKDKGTAELVEAFQTIKKRHPKKQFLLLLVGDFDARDVLNPKTADIINKDSNIFTTGWVSSTEMSSYYALMSVFVFPSYREGFGMSVIEASAMQVPVLVSKSIGCIDAVVENSTGYYIEINAESVAEGIEKFFDPNIREQFGKRGRKWVMENFEQSELWPQIRGLYDAPSKNNV